MALAGVILGIVSIVFTVIYIILIVTGVIDLSGNFGTTTSP